jgi:hypothetical protein
MGKVSVYKIIEWLMVELLDDKLFLRLKHTDRVKAMFMKYDFVEFDENIVMYDKDKIKMFIRTLVTKYCSNLSYLILDELSEDDVYQTQQLLDSLIKIENPKLIIKHFDEPE